MSPDPKEQRGRERPESKPDLSIIFDLGASDGSDIARDKDAMLAEAFASLVRKPRRRPTR
jgi:hypothetical protein